MFVELGQACVRRRPGGTHGVVPQGSWRGLALLAVLLVLAAAAGLALGSRGLSPATVVRALLHHGDDGGDAATVVWSLRVPRTVLAVLVGLALGVAGALTQGHTRNPLADPGLLGVEAGAACAVVMGIYVFGVQGLGGYTWFALLGAGLAGTVVFAIGSRRGGPDPITLVLAGAAVSALLLSLTQGIVLRSPDTLDDYRFWVVGSTAGRELTVARDVAPFLLAGLLLAALNAPGLNLLGLGDDVAVSLGVSPLRHRVVGIAAVTLLTGAATAACGPVGFVGLVVPHAARRFAGVDQRWVLAYAGLLGALLVVLADVVGRLVAPPGELQVGIVMALIGGPAFVVLVRRTRLVAL